jgi:hypothetical protein
MVIETGGDDRAPIILGRPFLSLAKAIIYGDTAKICFTIGETKERFRFKNCTLTTRVCPQHSYDYLDFGKILEKKNKILERKIPEKRSPEKKTQARSTSTLMKASYLLQTRITTRRGRTKQSNLFKN